jgi:membrane protease subunit HflK
MKSPFLYAVLAVIAVWTLLSAVTQVQPGEKAVVRRLGRILEDKPGPGLFIGLPWGLDRVDRVPVGMVKRVVVGMVSKEDDEEVDAPAGQLLTGDHNLVDVQAEVYYTVFEDQVDKYVLQADRADGLVARAAETVLAEWCAGRGVDEVLLHGKTLLPAYLIAQVQSSVRDYGLGVKIEEASINHLYPPKKVKAAFDRVAQAKTNIDTQVNEAQQKRDRMERETKAAIFRVERLTAAYAHEQRLQAQADAATFLHRLGEYRKLAARDPDYLNVLWQDEMTALYARMRENGRIDVLDQYLSSEGLNITQFPLLPKKK